MMLDKKANLRDSFLFKFKMDHKAAETSCSINNVFGPGTFTSYSAAVVQEVLQRRREA